MRIRMGLFGWMVLGPFILAVAIIFCMAKLTVVLFLALAKAIDTHNRRRGVRKAYQRDQDRRYHQYAQKPVQTGYRAESPSRAPTPISRRIPVDCTPQWQTSAPRDDPNWRPRAR
jgi:hypothetical protein